MAIVKSVYVFRGESMSGWVRFADREPEFDEYVLTCDTDRNIIASGYYAGPNNGGYVISAVPSSKYAINGSYAWVYATHWITMPEKDDLEAKYE